MEKSIGKKWRHNSRRRWTVQWRQWQKLCSNAIWMMMAPGMRKKNFTFGIGWGFPYFWMVLLFGWWFHLLCSFLWFNLSEFTWPLYTGGICPFRPHASHALFSTVKNVSREKSANKKKRFCLALVGEQKPMAFTSGLRGSVKWKQVLGHLAWVGLTLVGLGSVDDSPASGQLRRHRSGRCRRFICAWARSHCKPWDL